MGNTSIFPPYCISRQTRDLFQFHFSIPLLEDGVLHWIPPGFGLPLCYLQCAQYPAQGAFAGMLPRNATQGRQDDRDFPSWRPRIWRQWELGYRLLGTHIPRKELEGGARDQSHRKRWSIEALRMNTRKRMEVLALKTANGYITNRSKIQTSRTSATRRLSAQEITPSMPSQTANTHTASATRTGQRIPRKSASTSTE